MFMARRVVHPFLFVTVLLSATMVLLVPAAIGSGSAKYTVTAERDSLVEKPMTARLRILLVLTSCFVGLALSASAHAVTTLYAKTGPEFVISLKTTAGKKVTRLPAGTYRIVVSDRNGFDNPHNFRLRGPGVNRATG